MAINLNKGDRFDLSKSGEKGLSKIGVGLGWNPNEGASQFDFDLDASAFMLGKNKKLPQDEFFVFYNNPQSPDGAVGSSGDDRTGGNSDGDDETLSVDLTKVDKRVEEIMFTVTIHEYDKRKQNFGQVSGAFIRIYNEENGKELAKYELNEDFSTETAVEFGRLYRDGGQWKFEAIGNGYKGGLQFFVNKYA